MSATSPTVQRQPKPPQILEKPHCYYNYLNIEIEDEEAAERKTSSHEDADIREMNTFESHKKPNAGTLNPGKTGMRSEEEIV